MDHILWLFAVLATGDARSRHGICSWYETMANHDLPCTLWYR